MLFLSNLYFFLCPFFIFPKYLLLLLFFIHHYAFCILSVSVLNNRQNISFKNRCNFPAEIALMVSFQIGKKANSLPRFTHLSFFCPIHLLTASAPYTVLHRACLCVPLAFATLCCCSDSHLLFHARNGLPFHTLAFSSFRIQPKIHQSLVHFLHSNFYSL